VEGIYLFLLIGVFVFLLLLGFVVLIVRKRKLGPGENLEPDYHALFIMGICFLPMGAIGIATKNPGFFGISALGLIYLAIGLKNKDKWKIKNK